MISNIEFLLVSPLYNKDLNLYLSSCRKLDKVFYGS